MKEPDKQPNNQPGATDGEAASSADLTSRLMQRHNQPIGLVDTNHAERFHERTAGWVARRFDLLDSWKTRYDTGDTPGTGDAKFIFAATPVQSGPAISSEALVTSAARQVARVPSVPSAPSTSSPAPREQYRVRRPVAPPTSTASASTPNTSSSPTPTPLATDSTQAPIAPEGQTENVSEAGTGSAGVAGSDLKFTTGPAPDRADRRGAEITTLSHENLQPMTRLNATNQISRSLDSAKALSATEVDGDKTPASRVDRSSLPVQSTQQATAPMASPPIAELPVTEPGVSQTARSLTLVSARTEDVSQENPASEAVPTRVGEIASPPGKPESSAVPPLRSPDSPPQQVQRQPLAGGRVDEPTGSLPLRIPRKPSPGSEELRQQIDSSPKPGQQHPSRVAERLGRQTDPPAVEGQPSLSSERSAPLTSPLPPRIQPKPLLVSEALRPAVATSPQQVQRQLSQSSHSSPGSEELPQPIEFSPQSVQPQSSPGAERLGRQTEPLRVQAQPSPGTERVVPLTGSLPLRIQRQPLPGGEEVPQHSDSPVQPNLEPVATQATNPDTAAVPVHFAAQRRLSTTEIRVASVNGPSPATVLRKAAEAPPPGDGLLMKSSGTTNATLPLKVNRSATPVEVIVARQAEDVSSAGASPAASATSQESPAAAKQPGSIDLDQLAEQVGRVLSRQLAVERERRGNKGWH